ncbi:MAG: Gfo/Idh/MocA family protein [Armatimonadota bacterium]
MTAEIRVGMIGVGQIGKSHIQRYKTVPGARLVAVADVNEAEAQRVAAEYGIPEVYTDFRALLARKDIDSVDVCLHNNLHCPVTVAALEAGKHVYCEKPMAGAYRDAKTMFDTAKACDRLLSIQLSTLFAIETKAAKTLLDEGRLGKVYHGRSVGLRRRGRPYVDGYGTAQFVQKSVAAGGALYDMGVYHIAQLLFLMGNPQVTRVSGKTYQEIAMDPERLAKSGYDVEELGLGFVRFADAGTLDILEAWALHFNSNEGSAIFGSEGGVRLAPFTYFANLGDLSIDGAVSLEALNSRWNLMHGEVYKTYESPQHHWIAAQQGIVPLLPTAEIALNTMLISEGIYLSEVLGREVTAEEVAENSRSSAIDLTPAKA